MEPSLVKLHPNEQRLFDHYIHFVKEQLSPLAGFVCSAYAAIVPSIAISGQTSHTSIDAGLAVFHGVCGVAATSLSTNSPTNPGYRLEALHHEKLALRHIRRSIENGTDAYLTLAVAIMMLLLFEHLSGRAQEYRPHIQAGLRCLVLSEQGNPQDSTIASISEQFLLACALGNIVPNVRVGSLRRKLKDGRVGYFEEQAGMALGMLDIIISINECYAYRDHIPQEKIDDLGLQLALHAPSESSFVESFNGRTGAVAYYATCLYFARAVKRVPPNHPDAVWAVEQGIQQLEAMQPSGRELNNCVIAWAGCLIGSECELEEHKSRFMAWCSSSAARDMLNLAAITMVAQYSWNMKRETPEKYCLLWYQFAEGVEEFWYPDRKEIQYSPAGGAEITVALEEPSLAETLSRSEEFCSSRSKLG